jgi:hypothetical protein
MRVQLITVQHNIDVLGQFMAGRQNRKPFSIVGNGGYCWPQLAKVQLRLILVLNWVLHYSCSITQ